MSLSAPYGILVALVTLIAAIGVGALFTLACIALLMGHRRGGATGRFEDLIPKGLFLCMSFGIGAGLLSLFVLGLNSILNKYVAWCVIVAGFLLFRRCQEPLRDVIKGAAASVFGRGASGVAKLCMAGSAAIVAVAAVMALLPPVEIDALAYHLYLPGVYLAHGGLVETHSIVYSFFPLNTEMLYALAMGAGSVVAASLLHLLFGLFSAVAAGTIAARMTGEKVAGFLAAAIFFCTPLVFWEMGNAYNDLAACFFITASLATVLMFKRNGAVVAGLLAGFAVASKLSAGPYVLLILAMVVVMESGDAKNKVKAAFLFSVFCILPVLPWMIRTYTQTGNPVFPFLYGVFGGENWNPAVNAEFLKWHMGYGPGKGLLDFILMPYYLFFKAGGNFGWPGKMPDRELGYLLLVLLPFLFIPGRVMAHQRKLTFFVAAGFAVWFFGSQQLRFLLNFLPILCVLYAAKIVHIAKKERAVAVVFGIVITAAVGWQFFVQKGHVVDAVKVLAGGQAAKEKYIEENVPSYNAFKELDRIAADPYDKAEGAKAGLIFETRAFYSDTPVIWLDPTRQGVVNYDEYESGAQLLGRLRELEVKYLLVNNATFARLMKVVGMKRQAGLEYSEYFERFFILYYTLMAGPEAKMLWTDGTFAIYRLRDDDDGKQ